MSVPNEDSDDSQQRKALDAQKSEASIYKLYSKDPEIKDIYIRCTKRILTHMRKHYYTCRTSNTPRHNVYLYRVMREHGGWNEWTFKIMETIMLTTIA